MPEHTMSEEELRDDLADLEHVQWAHWTKYMLDNLTPENIARWTKQIDTPFSELSPEEQKSDYDWADKVLDILRDLGIIE